MKQILCSLLILFFTTTIFAQEFIDRNLTVTTKETEALAARKELQDIAVHQVTEELSREFMGNERYEKNRSAVRNRIAKMSGRYISYFKPGNLVAANPGPGYSMNIEMRISPINFKTLLQKAGLLSEVDTLPVVLPLVSFYDRVEVGTYKWWQSTDLESKRFLVTQARKFENSLKSAFKKQDFHLIQPMEIRASNILPMAFQSDRFSPDDKDFLGQMFQAPLVIEGQVEFLKSELGSNLYKIQIKMTAVQLSNNRPIADVSRKYDTEAGQFEIVVDKKLKQILEATTQDLAQQVYEAWQKGTVGTSVIRMTLRGKIPFQLREGLKDKIRAHVPQVKNVRERIVTSETISYEMDTAATPQAVGQKMNGLDIGGYKIIATGINDKEVIMELKR